MVSVAVRVKRYRDEDGRMNAGTVKLRGLSDGFARLVRLAPPLLMENSSHFTNIPFKTVEVKKKEEEKEVEIEDDEPLVQLLSMSLAATRPLTNSGDALLIV
jgi:hypothetical protein